jgi:hypothetical protein
MISLLNGINLTFIHFYISHLLVAIELYTTSSYFLNFTAYFDLYYILQPSGYQSVINKQAGG